MSQSGYTPIILLNSTTSGNTPTTSNLAVGELAINIADGKLFFNQSGTIKVLANATYATSVSTISFGTTGLTPSTATNGVVTVAGTLVTTNGGTGLSTYTAGDLPYYASGTALSKLGIGSSGQILTSTGSAPQWSTLSGVAVTAFSAGTTGFTPSTATTGAVTLSGTLATTNGGTGLTSFTANGVVYASSTSALATGSNLVFTGTNLGIGTSSPTYQLDVQKSTSQIVSRLLNTNTSGTSLASQLIAANNGVVNFQIDVDGTGANFGQSALLGTTTNHPLLFRTNNTEQMRLSSAGYLSVGTTSANGFITAWGSAVTSNGQKLIGQFYNNASSSTSATINIQDNASSNGVGIGSVGDNLAFYTATSGLTEKMRLTSAGYLGIGTSSPAAYFQVNTSNNTAYANTSPSISAVTSALVNSANYVSGGVFVGTQFNLSGDSQNRIGYIGAISMNSSDQSLSLVFGVNTGAGSRAEAMRLDASGNLGIGTTSPLSRIDARAASALIGNYQTIQAFSTDTATIDYGGGLSLGGYYNGTSSIAVFGNVVGRKENSTAGNYAGYLAFGTNAQATGVVERARITSAGNFCIGTTTALSAATGRTDLTVNGATTAVISLGIAGTRQGYIYAPTAGMNVVTETGDLNIQTTVANSVTFTTNAVERARIDSIGNLLVGTTSFSAPTGSSFQISPTYTLSGHVNGTASGQGYAYYYYNANNIGSITQSGTTAVLYNTTSDYRLKSNVQPVTSGLSIVNQLNPVNFTWASDNEADTGFLAHEFQSVIPRSVTGTKDAVDEDGKPVYQQMDNSGAIPFLVAAIKELNTLITAQAAEITALKAKVGI